MPGIFVEQLDEDLVEVKITRPIHDYIRRIRKVDGARFHKETESWHIPIESVEDLDEIFEDELIYVTPRHKLIEGVKPPKPPRIFKKVPKYEVQDLKQPLRDFQKFGVNFLAYVLQEKGLALLGDLMGSGKTFQSIATALLLKQQQKVQKVLVVVLASTRRQWEQEIEKFTHETSMVFGEFRAKYRQKDGKRYLAESIEDQKKAFIEQFKNSSAMFLITSYQGLQQNVEILEKGNFDMMIMDEAHYIKNRLSKTNKAAQRIVKPRTNRHKNGEHKGIPYTLFVTGTPIMNYPDELYGVFSVGGEKVFGKWRDFRKTYCTLDEYKEIAGYKNLSKLIKKVQSVLIRRTDDEIGVDLPTILEQDIWLDPHPNQVKLDEQLQQEQMELAQQYNSKQAKAGDPKMVAIEGQLKAIPNHRINASNHPNVFLMSKTKSVVEKYGKYAVKNVMDVPKFERCIELVKEIVDSGHKVVIFVNSRNMTVMLHKEIKKFTTAVRYVGGMTDEERDKRKWQFNHDPRCKVMIANSAGSTGLNLNAGKYLINYDLPYTPAEWDQRKYRIRRLDSEYDKVYIINLLNKGLYDEIMYKNIQTKQAGFDAIIENNEATKKFHQKMNIKKKKKKKDFDMEEEIVWV